MDSIRKLISESIGKAYQVSMLESEFDKKFISEERISNKDAAEKVRNRENFIGSHTYGEDLGDLGLMYVAYSYGEQHPLYVYFDDSWYYNYDDYRLEDGTPNIWTKKHLETLRPGEEVQGRPGEWIKDLINSFKKKYKITANTHSDLEPGEK
jgi:hypothetical protein